MTPEHKHDRELCADTADHLAACLREFENQTPLPDDLIGEELLKVIDPPVLSEAADGDPAIVLRQRLVQALAAGFLSRASGDSLDRIRDAVGLAEQAAAGELDQADLVPPDSQESE